MSRAPAAPPAAARVNPYLLLTLAPFFWSCNWVIGRGIATDIPPMAMTLFRWLLALLMLLPFVLPRIRHDWPAIRRAWKIMLLLGATGIAGQNALTYLALHYTTAINGMMLNPFIPVMIIAMSWLFLREPLSALQLAGVVVSLVGVFAIVARGSWEVLASFRLNGGDLLVILSMAMWSVYTICLRWGPRGVAPLSFLFALACVGVLWMFPLYLVEYALGRRMALTAANLGTLLSVALFASVLSYIFWSHGVEKVGARVAGLFIHLMPVFGVLLAWAFLGEQLHPYHVAGIALILTGIWITSRRGRSGSRAPAESE